MNLSVMTTEELRAALAARERLEEFAAAREAAKAVLDPGQELPEPMPPADETERWAEEIFVVLGGYEKDRVEGLRNWDRLPETLKEKAFRCVAKRMVKAATHGVLSLVPEKFAGREVLAARVLMGACEGFGDGSQGDARYMADEGDE